MTDLRTLFAQARSNLHTGGLPPTLPARQQVLARIEEAAAALPMDGPLHQIVMALDDLLTALVELEATNPETWTRTRFDPWSEDPDAELAELACEPVTYALRVSLYRLGQHAHRLTGSIETMRAIHLRAANMAEDPHAAEYRRDVLDRAWHGIGDADDSWAA
jgi:hypothetical protein